MSDSDEELYVCGTARLSQERIRRLHAVLACLEVRAQFRGGRLFISISGSKVDAEGQDLPIRIRDGQAPEHVGSFLEGHELDLEGLPVEIEFEPRGRTIGDEVIVLFQMADAFAERAVRVESEDPE